MWVKEGHGKLIIEACGRMLLLTSISSPKGLLFMLILIRLLIVIVGIVVLVVFVVGIIVLVIVVVMLLILEND